MKLEGRYSIETMDNANIVRYCLNCFPRMMYVLYTSEAPYFMPTKQWVIDELERAYFEWHKDENADFCCEEFILDNIDRDLRSHIVAVLYDNDDSDED